VAKAAKSDDTLQKVLKDFNSSWEYTQGSWHQRWQDNYSLYNNNRVNEAYKGITNTFVPMTFSTIETLTSALFGTKPKFNYLAPSDQPDQKTDILNALLDFYWDKDQWSIKVINWGRTMLQLGTGIVYLYWENDHPCMINVPIRDFFFDPTCTTLENARFTGRRYLTTKEELEAFEIVDLDATPDEQGNYPMKKKYSNLNNIKAGPQGDPTDKQEKDMWYGSTVNTPENNQIEVLEYWTNDRVISVANRSTVIEDSENYYLSKAKANGAEYPEGLMPFAALRDYVDESLFLAKGEIDFIAEEQELLNDLTNQNIDSITYALNQMYTLDPKYAHMIQEIENLPGAVYPVEAGMLNPIPMGNVPQDAFNERLNIKTEIRETTASNEVVRGVSSDTQATATEINAQIAGAGQRINLKITQIENEGFHRLARIVLDMVKLYVTEPMMVRIIGEDGARWEEFDPSEFQGDYEPRVLLDINVQGKKDQRSEQAKEMLGAFMGDPDINQQELKKLVLARSFDLDPDEVEMLLQPMAPPEMAEMEEGMMPEEMPVEEASGMPMDELLTAPEPAPVAPAEPPMTDAFIDPMSGELIPMAMANEPTVDELIALQDEGIIS
jgi:hypothetical protein